MSVPAVSILVPIYNGSKHLAETLDSLLKQTFTDFELLAIDDGSTDDSAAIVAGFHDSRVRLIRKTNGGLCDALNRGIAEANAPFIARCDQDDISFPQRLARQIQVMHENPDALALFSYSTKFGGKHRWSNADKFVAAPGTVKVFEPMKDGCMLCSTMFMRTEVLRSLSGFRQEYYPVDDWDLELRLWERGKVLILCEPLIAYRFHASANTYRLFAQMREKTRWATDASSRRQQNLPELTLQQFQRTQPHDLWTRLRRRRKDSSALHMRIAGQRYLDGHYISGAWHALASLLLNPAQGTRRLTRYFSQGKSRNPRAEDSMAHGNQ